MSETIIYENGGLPGELKTDGGLVVTDATWRGPSLLMIEAGNYDGFVYQNHKQVEELVAALQKWLEETK